MALFTKVADAVASWTASNDAIKQAAAELYAAPASEVGQTAERVAPAPTVPSEPGPAGS